MPAIDDVFLDGFSLNPAGKAPRDAQLLHGFPVELGEWAVHPGIDDPEMRAIDSLGPEVRQTDYDFLISAEARELIKREGITLLSYQPLRRAWRDR